jgi:lysozyme
MTLKAGIDLIKKFEGCRLKSYPDPATGGKPYTIGWGSTKDTHGKPFGLGTTITEAQADTLLMHTIENEYLPALKKIPHWNEMNENQQGALLSFAYNLGTGFYGGSNFNTITRNLREKNWTAIPKTLEIYCNPGSNVEAGLLRRRKAEGKLWSTPYKD